MNKDIFVSYPQFGTESTSGYNLKINGDTITVKPKNLNYTTIFTSKGLTSKLSLTNTGNGVKINLDGRKINLDYSEVEELSLLLKLHQKISNQEFIIQEISIKDLELK